MATARKKKDAFTDVRVGKNHSGNGKPQVCDGDGVDRSQRVDDRQQGRLCACGCGETVRPGRTFRHGHWARTRPPISEESKRERYQQFLDNAPLCQCGCNKRVGIKNACSLQSFMRFPVATPIYSRFRRGHGTRAIPFDTVLSPLVRQAILGTLLGDSSIGYPHSRSKAPRVYGNHSFEQREWARHKCTFLKSLGATSRVAINDGHGRLLLSWATKCSRCLVGIHDLVCGGGSKRISREWLDGIGSIGLAWWLCDDGSGACSTGNFSLHTEGFSEDEHEIIREWFLATYGDITFQHTRRGHTFCRIPATTQDTIWLSVKDYIPKCMQYKFRYIAEHHGRRRKRRVRP